MIKLVNGWMTDHPSGISSRPNDPVARTCHPHDFDCTASPSRDILRVMRFWALPWLALQLAAQTPSFEVASIRPSQSSVTSAGLCYRMKPGTVHVQAAGVSLAGLLIDAYEGAVDRFELPNWANSRFDLSVQMPPNTNGAACKQMLGNLLAERFHMVTAVETVDMPTYILRVAKTGLKLKPVDIPSADPGGGTSFKTENGRSHWTFHGAPMSRIFIPIQAGIAMGARAGVFGTDRVIDQTGLTGYYDGELEFQNSSQANADDLFRQAPTIDVALIEQTGLTLELRKAPGKILRIRSSDRQPTEN